MFVIFNNKINISHKNINGFNPIFYNLPNQLPNIYPNSYYLHSINKMAPKCKKILQLLRLRQLHNGVFIKMNKATMNMVRYVEPYLVYGYTSRKTISDLLYKRGFAKING